MDAETITPNDDQIIFSVALPLKLNNKRSMNEFAWV